MRLKYSRWWQASNVYLSSTSSLNTSDDFVKYYTVDTPTSMTPPNTPTSFLNEILPEGILRDFKFDEIMAQGIN